MAARDVIRGLLAKAMRASMHFPVNSGRPPRAVPAPAKPSLGYEPIPDGADPWDPPAEARGMDRQHVEFDQGWPDSLDYDPKTKLLTITMKGVPYEYADVPQDVFDEFSTADDPSDYYHDEFHQMYHSR